MNKPAEEQVRAYIRFMGRPFTYKSLVADLGICVRSATKIMAKMKEPGEIVSIGKPKEGIYKATTAKQREKIMREREKERRAEGSKAMAENGERWHKRLLAM